MDAARALLAAKVPYLPGGLSWLELLVLLQVLRYLVLPLVRAAQAALASSPGYIRAGEWAVVTGGNDGIGKAYAQALLARGMSVLIIARNREKLEAARKELQAKGPAGAEVDIHVADFSKAAVYPEIGASACHQQQSPALPLLSSSSHAPLALPHTLFQNPALRAQGAQGAHFSAH